MRFSVSKLSAGLAGAFILCSCASTKMPVIPKPELDISKMTLQEKIGQMFVIRPESLDSRFNPAQAHDLYDSQTLYVTEEIKEKYSQFPAGGFIIFGKNIEDKSQLKELTYNLHCLPNYPLIYTDEEGGRVLRLGRAQSLKIKKIKPMGEIGKTNNPKQAYKAGQKIGKYLSEYGIDVDFAPIADVNSNPENPVIGDRAFSSDPYVVAKMNKAFNEGLSKNHVEPCLKHFPGHGDTATDSHHGYAETNKDWGELLDCEMIPFKSGIQNNVQFIMTAHIAAPKVTGNSEPSTVSKKILTDKLRVELGYKNLVITDAMNMGAITKHYTTEQSIIKAIQAGVDIILMPFDYEKAFNALLSAVQNGTIPESRINDSVERILNYKKSRFQNQE